MEHLLNKAVDCIKSLEGLALDKARFIEDLQWQINQGHCNCAHLPHPSPVVVSKGENADDEEDAKEEAEVRSLVENHMSLGAIGLEFYAPPEENKEPLPVIGTSDTPHPGIRFVHVLPTEVRMLAQVRQIQEVMRMALMAEESDVERWRMVVEAFEDPTFNN
jgi:hypothetical protein